MSWSTRSSCILLKFLRISGKADNFLKYSVPSWNPRDYLRGS